jgi:hypothetical protein
MWIHECLLRGLLRIILCVGTEPGFCTDFMTRVSYVSTVTGRDWLKGELANDEKNIFFLHYIAPYLQIVGQVTQSL